MSKIYLPIEEVTTDTEVKYILFDKITQKLTKNMMLLPRYKADFEVNDENEQESDSADEGDGQYPLELVQKKRQQLLKTVQEAQVAIQKLLQEKQDKAKTQQGVADKKHKTQQTSNSKQKDSITKQKDAYVLEKTPICQSIQITPETLFIDIQYPKYKVKRWYE